MSIEAMKQALEALYMANTRQCPGNKIGAAINALSAAIEQAEKQEPVALMYDFLADDRDEVIRDWVTQSQDDINRENGFNVRPLYTAPRQEPYDQTSLELCKECGWRAVIPSDGCLVCARQKAKPVAYTYTGIRQDGSTHGPHLVWKPEYMDAMSASKGAVAIPLYAAPRQWVELTDEEVHEGFCHVEYETPNDWNTDPDDWCQQFARYLEAKLKEKNHG